MGGCSGPREKQLGAAAQGWVSARRALKERWEALGWEGGWGRRKHPGGGGIGRRKPGLRAMVGPWFVFSEQWNSCSTWRGQGCASKGRAKDAR